MHHITSAQYQNFESWSQRGYRCLLVPNRAGYQLIPYRWRWFANLNYRIRLIWEAITFSYLRTVPHEELELYHRVYLERQQGSLNVPELCTQLSQVADRMKGRQVDGKNIPLTYTYRLEMTVHQNFVAAYRGYCRQQGRKDFFVGKFLCLIPHHLDANLGMLKAWQSELDSNPRI